MADETNDAETLALHKFMQASWAHDVSLNPQFFEKSEKERLHEKVIADLDARDAAINQERAKAAEAQARAEAEEQRAYLAAQKAELEAQIAAIDAELAPVEKKAKGKKAAVAEEPSVAEGEA